MIEYTDSDTIFVSIASYRDNKCSNTIESLFANANKPNNIWVGLCEQNDKGDKPCFSPRWESRVRQIKIPFWDAKGPTWARYLCASLMNGEKYFLQIDSHSLFMKDWDLYLVKTIKDLEGMGFKKAVLSHYIRSDKYYNEKSDSHTNSVSKIPTICTSSFNKKGMIVLDAAHDIELADPRPKPNAYISGHMLFGNSKFVDDVPFDPNLPYLFMGEEILYSARLWTNGWNIFTPTKNVIYHYYIRDKNPKFWSDIKDIDEDDALNKVKYLLQLEKMSKKNIDKNIRINLDKYGLGTVRTIYDYYDFAGIKLNEKSKSSQTNFCKSSIDELYALLKKYDNKTTIYKSSKNYNNIILLLIVIIVVFFIIYKNLIRFFRNKINTITHYKT